MKTVQNIALKTFLLDLMDLDLDFGLVIYERARL